jgi:hypothetical protein
VDDAFNAISAAIVRSASDRSADVAISEAERHGLIKQSATRADREIWEKTDGATTLRFQWRWYDPSHAYRTFPDINVLSLELQEGDKTLRHAEERYEDSI